MQELLPHWVLTALVAVTALLFLEKGRRRRDLLCMGLAALFLAGWMISVTMIDFTVQRVREVPLFWMALSVDAQLPALFLIYISVLQLEKYYHPGMRIRLRDWLPLGIVLGALAVGHWFDPDLFYRRVGLAAPDPGRLHLNPLYALKFSLGPGYFIFLAAAAYVVYGVVTRFPRIIDAMQLPEAERRTRVLLSMGVLAAFWIAAFDVMPTLFSTSAPSFMRLVGPALCVAGIAYAMILTRAFDPRVVFRNGLFYSIRILLIAVPAMVLLARYREILGHLSPRWAGFVSLCIVIAVDFAVLRLKPLLDWLALRKSYSSIEAINHYVHELLVARDARAFTRTVKDFVRLTVGSSETHIWMPPLDNPKGFYDADENKRIEITESTRRLLTERACAMTPDDLQLDPLLYPYRDELSAFFKEVNALVITPLVDEERLVGLLTLGAKENYDRYYDQDLKLLDSLRAPTALALLNALHFEAAKLGKPLKIYDRGELDEALGRVLQQVRRSNESLSLGLLRIESPQTLDHEYGEGTAARYLAEAAEQLRIHLRGRDLPALYDPHTLALLMPNTKLQGGEIAIRRVRTWLQAAEIEVDGKILRANFTIGLATRTEETSTLAELYRTAEEGFHDATAISTRP